MNLALKVALLSNRPRLTQTELAKKTGIHESRLSRIVNGHDLATDDEKRNIARALRKSVSDLFEAA